MLNRAKNYYENDKERLREKARNKYRNFLKKIKRKKENMEKIDIIICLKKRSKNWKNIKNRNIEKQKSLRNKIFLPCHNHFFQKHSNSKETEVRDSSTWDPDWRALYAATIWEQSILCLVHSTRCRPGLTQTNIPLEQLRCTSGQGPGPQFGWD